MGLWARRIDSSCSGGTFDLIAPPGAGFAPAIAAHPGGNYVLVWTGTDGNQGGIRGRQFNALGNPLGAEFQVNSYTTGNQTYPSIAMVDDGSFQVAWNSSIGDGDAQAVFARRFRPDGSPCEADFVVNTYTTGSQFGPFVSSDANGNFVVTWNSAGQDGDGVGVFGQRFGGVRPAPLRVDASGNNMLEPGETVTVAPSWQNVNGAAQSLGGVANTFTGPWDPVNHPTYNLSDGNADYGAVPNGATVSCTATGNCYQVSVTMPVGRPAVHWDASLLEEITPSGFSQSSVWPLHVGESFADVPRTSPFYRFVETLLHKNVTSGCTGTTYCPTSSTTREQMPVFVLVSKEGTGYAPAPCTTAPFNDVPVSGPFCRWIQELARRGVVTGCGGGNYCPADPVSRETMAVFVLATLEGSSYTPPPCATSPFADVPVSSPFCPWIQELANRGVVSGCGGGNYCPADPVSREQMGVFLTVSFGLQLYGP
jgi:hypothetical protein